MSVHALSLQNGTEECNAGWRLRVTAVRAGPRKLASAVALASSCGTEAGCALCADVLLSVHDQHQLLIQTVIITAVWNQRCVEWHRHRLGGTTTLKYLDAPRDSTKTQPSAVSR